MTTHILSMTYQPKIAGVMGGSIRQTIRRYNPKRPFVVGDKLLIHGWGGKPYRSPWNWRMEAEVIQVSEIECYRDYFIDEEDWVHRWDISYGPAPLLAMYDGIDPPTGWALKEVLEKFHGKFTDEPVRFQVIRW